MKKSSHRTKSHRASSRFRSGAFISTCLVSLFALVMCIVIVPGLNTPASEAPSVADEDTAATDINELVVEPNAIADDSSSNYVTASNGATYEKNKVLLSVDANMSAADVNAILANYDFAETKDVSNQNLSRGFVEVQISPDVEVPTAAIYLGETGLHTQPNYIYHAADEEEDLLMSALTVEIDDSRASEQWALNSIDAYKAWGIQKAGDSNISVAVIDTGYKNDHEDLEPNVIAAAGYVKNGESGSIVEGKSSANDTHGHGTHVAGIVSAQADNGKGVDGVSYNAGLVIIKATQTEGKDDFSTVTVADALNWLTSDDDGNGKTIAEERNVRVVNMSVGAKKDAFDTDLNNSIDKAYNQGLLSVCASGNEGANGAYMNIPGDYEKCLNVINLQHNYVDDKHPINDSGEVYNVSRNETSNYNLPGQKNKTISAPGQRILSTTMTSTSSYGIKDGTSMASPYVAGVAALVLANKPSLSAQQTRDLLEATATPIDSKKWSEQTGYGEVDAYHALQITSARISQASVEFKGTEQLTLEAKDGSPVSSDEWTWESSDDDIVSVDARTGVITGLQRGKAKITATYTKVDGISTEGYIAVDPIDLAQVTVDGIAPQTYTGSRLEPRLSVSYKGTTLEQGSDYSVSYSNNIGVGTATATISGGLNGDYAKSIDAPFDIVKADISSAVIDLIPAQPYTGTMVTPHPTVRFNGNVLVENVDYMLSYENNVDRGDDACVIVKGMGNFEGTCSATFSISSSDISVASISGLPTNLIYTGSELRPVPTVNCNGDILQEGVNFTCEYANNVNAGTATLTVKGINDYIGMKSVTFKIGKANISSASISGIPSSMEHTGKALRPTPVVTHNGVTLKTGTDYTYSYDNNVNIGTATFTLNGRGNYTGSQSMSFSIVQGKSTNQGSTLQGNPSSSSNNSSSTNNNSSTNNSSSNSSSSSTNNNSSNSNNNSSSASSANVPEAATNASGTWVKYGSQWWFKYDDATKNATGKSYPANEFINISNATYHFDAGGWLHTGWKQISGSWFYFTSSGIMAKSWTQVGNAWYHLGNDGRMLANKFKTEGNKTYYFTSSGAMAKGWAKADGNWYWFTDSGVMAKGWLKLGNTWYHLGTDGAMITGLKHEGNATYYFNGSGAMVTGWQKIGNIWYYFSGSGNAVKGWQRIGGAWYYFDYEGEMLTGWQDIDGARYYLTSSGAMGTGWQLADGAWYYFNGSGAMLKGWQYVGNTWYYLNPADGRMITGWKIIDNYKYYFNGSGVMVTGWQYVEGSWYYFNRSGAQVKDAWIGNYWLGSDGKMATSAWVDGDKYYVDGSGVWIPNMQR